MRPFHFYSTVFLFVSAATFVAADGYEIIGNQDPRIFYSEEWEHIPFGTGTNDTLSTNIKASGTASLTVYNATGIDVHVLVQSPGQTVQISLDNQQHDVAVYDQPAWSNNSLDPSIPHALQVVKQNPAGQYTSLDYILVTHHDPLVNTVAPSQTVFTRSVPSVGARAETTSNPATPGSLSPHSSPGDSAGAILSSRTTQSTWRSDPSTLDSPTPHLLPTASSTFPAQQSSTEPVWSGGKLAAVIAVCIAIPTFIIAGTFQYRQKQRKAASTTDIESIAARGYGPPQSL